MSLMWFHWTQIILSVSKHLVRTCRNAINKEITFFYTWWASFLKVKTEKQFFCLRWCSTPRSFCLTSKSPLFNFFYNSNCDSQEHSLRKLWQIFDVIRGQFSTNRSENPCCPEVYVVVWILVSWKFLSEILVEKLFQYSKCDTFRWRVFHGILLTLYVHFIFVNNYYIIIWITELKTTIFIWKQSEWNNSVRSKFRWYCA